MKIAWKVETFPREVFSRDIFDYEDGQHVLFGGPTQMAGKTTLAFQLLKHCASPERPAYVAVSKPKDPVTAKYMKAYKYRLVTDWPPPPRVQDFFDGKPSGYVIWPKMGDINTDAGEAARVTAALLSDRYAAGVKNKKGILVVDDTVVKSKLLGLDRQMTTHIAMAGAMDLGGWYFVQKPTGSGDAAIWAYGNSAHKFLSHESDKRNRIRYNEIGGFDSAMVGDLVGRLDPYEFLYLNNKREICIVGAK